MNPADDPIIIEWRCEIAAEGLDAIAWQAAAASRFLMRGNINAALVAYGQVQAFLQMVAPEILELARLEPVTDGTGWSDAHLDAIGVPRTKPAGRAA